MDPRMFSLRPFTRLGSWRVALTLAACGVASPGWAAERAPAPFDTRFQTGFEAAFAGTAPAANAANAPADPRAGIPFVRSRAVTRDVERGLAEHLGENFSLQFAIADPAEFLRSGKASELAARELKTRGLPEDSVAGATALLLAVAWELANGLTLSGQDHAAILKQTTAVLRGNALEREADAQRQTQADLRLLSAALWREEAYLREPFPAQMQALSDAVHRDILALSNNDMRALVVTEDGLVERAP